jgi:hypothetical protein
MLNILFVVSYSGGGHSLQTNGFSGAAWYGRGAGAGGFAGA